MEIELNCYEPTIIAEYAEQGFQMTFGDMNRQTPMFIAEDGKGGWVMFALVDGGKIVCIMANGKGGFYAPLPPNL